MKESCPFFLAHPGPWMMRPDAFAALRSAMLRVTIPEAMARRLASPIEPVRAYSGGPWDPEPVSYGPDRPPPPGYPRHDSGAAIVPIRGTIVRYATPLAAMMAEMCGGCCLDHVLEGVRYGLDHPDVRGIVLAVDSPGGEGSGLSEAARRSREKGYPA